MELSRYFILLLIAIVSHAAVIFPERRGSVVEDADVEMRFAGSADGKSFFAYKNNTGTVSWFEAGNACQSMNMELAEITSQSQKTTIRASISSGQVWGTTYWIGARDSQETRQFSWNSTNNEFALFGTTLYSKPAFATCLGFHLTSSTDHMHIDPCTSKKYYWMCQA